MSTYSDTPISAQSIGSAKRALPADCPIVFFAALPFDSCLSGRTRLLAEALAAIGHPITFVEMPSLRQLARPLSMMRRSFTSQAGLRVLRIPPLPWRLSRGVPMLADTWARWVIGSLRRRIERLDEAVLVTSTPWWLPIIRGLPGKLRCYDYIDHVDVQAGPNRIQAFKALDRQLITISDLCTTVSEPLRKYLVDKFPADRLHLIPNGVLGNWITSPTRPVDRRALSPRPERPIAGFLGALFEWVDVDLIAEAARKLPAVEFVIVGPTRRGVSIQRLGSVPNIRLHAAVPFDRVPATVAAFDVCLIPFKRDLISEYADPLKVYEYCALGRPVVSTVLFNAGGPEPPMAVADNVDAFVSAIRAALSEPPHARDERIEFARQHTWEARARQFSTLLSS